MLARTQRYKTLRFILERHVEFGSDAPEFFGKPGELVTITCEGGDMEVAIDDFEAAEKLLASPRLEDGDLWVTLGGGAVEGYPVLREAVPHGATAKGIAEIVVELENRCACEIIRACEDEGKQLWDEVRGWPEERLKLEDRSKAAEDLLRMEISSPDLRADVINQYLAIREAFHGRVREMEVKSTRMQYLEDFREEMKWWHGELTMLDDLSDGPK